MNKNNQLVPSIPSELKALIRTVMLGFYNFEAYLCMEHLMIHMCVDEEDLADLLKLDLKPVHQNLQSLKRDKFLNERLSIEKTSDGKHLKHSYFYINYIMAVNVIKYKLDQIRKRIEFEDKNKSKSYFKCLNCSKIYTDLDLKDLFLTMRCTNCGSSDIKEDFSRSNRNLLTIFNTQMNYLFSLLKKIENINLPDSILRPKPIDLKFKLKSIESLEKIKHQSLLEPEEIKKDENLKILIKTVDKKIEQIRHDQDLESTIMKNLLKYEFKYDKKWPEYIKFDDDQSDVKDELIPRVMVANKPVRFDLINAEMIALMNDNEKQSYISLIRVLYEQVFE